jgi:hypothetical protein
VERLQTLINRLKKFEEEVFIAIEKVIRENEAIIVEMNSEDQLFESGINRDGVSLNSFAPYSAVTIQIKGQKGQPTNRVTLRDEGDFHFSFFIEFRDDGFKIVADDWKAKRLISGYGENILGLTDENFRDLAVSYVAPEIFKLLKEL